MANPMKYVKDLEAAGFERQQAEAQVQMVLDALEGDLVTKADFAVFQERIENRLAQFEQRNDKRFVETEFRLITRLGFLMVSTTSLAVAVLTWLIKT
jgi:hypothetical protein